MTVGEFIAEHPVDRARVEAHKERMLQRTDQFARYHRLLMGTAIGTLVCRVRRIYDRMVAKPTMRPRTENTMMPVEVIYHEYTTRDEHWEDHTTVYAHRVTGDYFLDLDDGERSVIDRSSVRWHIGGSDLTVYPDEVDAYIELFQKIKAASKPE